MDQLIEPAELLSSSYYWRGVSQILCEFNSQVTSNAAKASYQDVDIRCDSLVASEVTQQLLEAGWHTTTHDYGNGIVKVTVDVHQSTLSQRWEDMG